MTIKRQKNELLYRIIAIAVITTLSIFVYFISKKAKDQISYQYNIATAKSELNDVNEKIEMLKKQVNSLDDQNKKLLKNNIDKRELKAKLMLFFNKVKDYRITIKELDYYKNYSNLVYVELIAHPNDNNNLIPKEILLQKLKIFLEVDSIKKYLKPMYGYKVEDNSISFIYHKPSKY